MSELLMDQLAATNMVYARFSFPYFLASMQRSFTAAPPTFTSTTGTRPLPVRRSCCETAA